MCAVGFDLPESRRIFDSLANGNFSIYVTDSRTMRANARHPAGLSQCVALRQTRVES